MIDRKTAVAIANNFLRRGASDEGAYVVRAEQDFWIITAPAENGETISVLVDVADGQPYSFHESFVDAELERKE